jgi:flagellar protein FliJ
MTASHDPGLRAVARVRGVRERDSRLGLQHALTLTAQRESQAALAQTRLDDAEDFREGTSAQFHARRTALAALAAYAQRARELAEASRTSTEEAQRRWQRDRSRLRAVESLLQRRAEARNAEAVRRESHELDDVATRLWLRRRGSGPEGGDAA